MTKEEAIKYLQQLHPNGGHCWLDEQRIEAIGMAVKALQEEPLSEDMEYASEKYSCRFSSSKYGHDKIKSAFKAGAKRQKEQMMKSAITAHCFGFQGGAALFSFELPAGNYLVGSEVKATLIKEE